MKKVTRRSYALILSVVVAWLACAISAHAQQRDPNQPRPAPSPTPYQRKTENEMVLTPENRSNNQNRVGTPSLPNDKLGQRAQTTPASGPQLLELRCRGGGLQIDVTSGEMRQNDLYMNMTVRFRRAADGAGITGQILAPGQCALPDRALAPDEPIEMRAEVINFGQRNRKMHGDPVYVGDPAAEKYPDAQNIPPYLANANHYWSFFGFNTFDGYFRITDQHYWKPTSVRNSTGRLEIPADTGRPGNRKLETSASSMTRDRDPIPNNAVRIYIRYSKALGYVSTSTAFGNVGPYSCDAFTVDAHTGGLGGYKSAGNSIVSPARMTTEGSYYVCGFTITGLPLNQTLNISAAVTDEARFLTAPWQGEGQPRPPRGFERAILKGIQSVTLSNRNPSDIVTFEMAYAAFSTPPR